MTTYQCLICTASQYSIKAVLFLEREELTSFATDVYLA